MALEMRLLSLPGNLLPTISLTLTVFFLLAAGPAGIQPVLAGRAAGTKAPFHRSPSHLEFYMYIAVQNNSNLHNPVKTYTAVQSGQPPSPQRNSFGVIHTFDNPLTSAPDLKSSTRLGRVQGWYGDVGQELLTLLLVQTFTYDDGRYNGSFSLLGVDVATDAKKYGPIVGGTGDFAYVRGVAEQTLLSTATVNSETVSWFHFAIDFKH